MSKPFTALLFGGIFFMLGLLTAAILIEYEPPRIANHVIDSAIILEIPRTDADLSMSIIYQEAELAMLREIQKQKDMPPKKVARKGGK